MLSLAVLALSLAALPPIPGWKVQDIKDEMADKVITVIFRDGDRQIATLAGHPVTPAIRVRCGGKRSDVMLFTGTAVVTRDVLGLGVVAALRSASALVPCTWRARARRMITRT